MVTIKSYTFSMERILELRENVEKYTMEEFAQIQGELLHQKSILTNLLKIYESIKEKNLEKLNVQELRQHELYKQSIEDRIENQKKLIEEKTDELEQARLNLVEAQKERKIMENLKEIDFNMYQENLKLQEQNELNELAMQKHQMALFPL